MKKAKKLDPILVKKHFLGTTHQDGGKIPNNHKYIKWSKIYQMAIKLPTSSLARPSKIYPNLDFWLENKPSGNLG
jgi:hypothetical protein